MHQPHVPTDPEAWERHRRAHELIHLLVAQLPNDPVAWRLPGSPQARVPRRARRERPASHPIDPR